MRVLGRAKIKSESRVGQIALPRDSAKTQGSLSPTVAGAPVGIRDDDFVFCLRPSHKCSVSDALGFIKTNSSKWVHQKWPRRSSFAWQLGYGAFGVSKSNIPEVEDYIRRQKKHHRKLTYKKEFLAFLRKHGTDYDERYVWD